MKRTREARSGIVLVFIRQRYQSQRMKMGGVYVAAVERNWQIQPIDEPYSAVRLHELRKLWNPIGCLVDESSLPPVKISKRDLGSLPLVIMGKDKFAKTQTFDYSVQNAKVPAVAAARKLRDLDLRHFAYFGAPGSPAWSDERKRHFCNATRSWGCRTYSGSDPNTANGLSELATWLKRLDRPAGVLLAADFLALPFYTAASKSRLVIGKDLFVIGVDNDEQICTSLSPTLTSVHLDFFRAGINAITLLERRLNDPSPPPQTLTYGINYIANRGSTARCYVDPRLGKGLLYIDEHGCERITASSVAAQMGCCRRQAEKIFRAQTGETILNAIRKMRFEKAKALIETTDYPLDEIPPMCGYLSLPHFKTAFRERTGMTMRDWRNDHRKVKVV